MVQLNKLFIWLTASCILGCAGPAWKNAQKVSNIDVYEDFIKKFPNSKFTDAARQKLDSLYFDKVKKKGSMDEYEEFLSNFPNSKFIDEARQNLDQIFSEINDFYLQHINYINTDYEIKYPDTYWKKVNISPWKAETYYAKVIGYKGQKYRNAIDLALKKIHSDTSIVEIQHPEIIEATKKKYYLDGSLNDSYVYEWNIRLIELTNRLGCVVKTSNSSAGGYYEYYPGVGSGETLSLYAGGQTTFSTWIAKNKITSRGIFKISFTGIRDVYGKPCKVICMKCNKGLPYSVEVESRME